MSPVIVTGAGAFARVVSNVTRYHAFSVVSTGPKVAYLTPTPELLVSEIMTILL